MDVTARTIDQAIEVGNHIYHQHRLTDRSEGRFWMRQRAYQVGPAIIGTLQYGGPVRIDAAEFIDSYQVNVPLFGEVLMSYGGQQERATPRRAVVHGPTAPSWIDGWHVPTRLIGLKIFRTGLESELARMTGHAVDRPVRFAGMLDVTTAEGREWLALTGRLAWWAQGGDDSFITPMLVEGVIRTLLRAAPHDHSHTIAEATAGSGDAAARRAVVLMHAHARHAISVPEIAEAAGIGVRALEKQVLAHWRLTPSALLREIRLCYARRELQQSAGRAKVADVAARWGMPHAGRFAAHYTEQFGEAPSATLMRALASCPAAAVEHPSASLTPTPRTPRTWLHQAAGV